MIIELQNGAKENQGSRAGKYERSSDVNGKPSYKNDDNAIWYSKENNNWMVGTIDDIGGINGFVYARDDFGGLTDKKNLWKYSVPTRSPLSSTAHLTLCSA